METQLAYRTEAFVTTEAVGGFLEPVGRRSSYTASRLAVLQDGTTKPVLLILAERKYGSWDEERFPFWIDGQRQNETLTNVGLATRSAGKRRRRSRSLLGVPSGTKEYMKRWHQAHPDAVRTASRKYATRRRETERLLAERVLAHDALPDLADDATDVPEIFSKLADAAAAAATQKKDG